MLKNFLTTAWRSLLRNKLHTFINITGLAIGVSACLVIYLIVNFELSFNKGHDGYEKIYRIHSSFSGVFSGLNRGVPTAVAETIREEFKGVESVAPFHVYSTSVSIPAKGDSKTFENQNRIILTDTAFFHVFSAYTWIAGSPQSLDKPFQVVLTESRAKTYFGTTDPLEVIGKEIVYQDSLSTTVAGIVKDLPFNTDIDMTDFISYSTIEKSWLKSRINPNDWSSVNSSSQLFVRLDKNATEQDLKSQFTILSKRYKEHSTWDVENNFNAQAFTDLHYNAETGIFDYSRSPAHLPTLSILTVVALLLLVMGAINFVNLETAQSVHRAKEVGVRKTLGSSRTVLLVQFLCQSFIITVVAIILALPLTELALQAFSDFVPAGVSFSITALLPFLGGIVLVLGLLAGLYPAFILSSFKPVLALKNQAYINRGATRSAFLRKTLIVFQFSIAQILIIATLAVSWQVNYLLNSDIGFKKDAVLYFHTPWQEQQGKVGVLKNELSQLSEISSLSLSDSPPSANGWSSSTYSYKPPQGDIVKANVFRKYGDSNYIPFYGMTLLAGRNIRATDSLREFVINKTLMKTLGFSKPEDAIGQEIITSNNRAYPVVGVVDDFHIQSLRKKIEPVIMGNSPNFSCFNIRLTASTGTPEFKAALAKLEDRWKKVYPDKKFEYSFLDETLNNFYTAEQRTSKLVRTAMGMAIVISCLGLFGLASFTTTQRTKEIGIRKVLGSSVSNIIIMLSKDFMWLIVIGFVVASPLAWMATNQWLNEFAYHTTLSAWIFIATAIAGIALAFLTVAYQTFKAANSNPVSTLRNE